MKKLLVLGLVLSSATAFATRARTTALGNAAHLTDVNTVYATPRDMMKLSDSLTIESGKTDLSLATDNANQGAEGLMIRSMGDAKIVLGLGHDDATVFENRKATQGTLALRGQQNPLLLGYGMKSGDLNFAGTLYYSKFENKLTTTPEKEDSMGLNLGASSGAWWASLGLGLTDKWSSTTGNEYKGKSNIAVAAGYDVSEELYVYADIKTGGYKATVATVDTLDVSKTNITVGAVSSRKKDGTEVFYGIALASVSEKDAKTSVSTDDTETTKLEMPLIIGMEADANSWLTLRGSIKQDVLLVDNEKTTAGSATTSETSPGRNSTTFAAGAGLKFNKVTIDGSLLATAGQEQIINGNNLLGTVGLTYNF